MFVMLLKKAYSSGGKAISPNAALEEVSPSILIMHPKILLVCFNPTRNIPVQGFKNLILGFPAVRAFPVMI